MEALVATLRRQRAEERLDFGLVLGLRRTEPRGGPVAHVKDYERLTIAAALSGSRSEALQALVANPLVADLDTAQPLLDALLEVNRRYLPRFWPGG